MKKYIYITINTFILLFYHRISQKTFVLNPMIFCYFLGISCLFSPSNFRNPPLSNDGFHHSKFLVHITKNDE